MAIYQVAGDKERFVEVPPTSFGQEGILERSDLQRMLINQPDILEDGLFILTEEFSNWDGSGRSIDLLGLDATGRLVVIELKRGETGAHMDLQAIRYAAMVSTITLQQASAAHQVYLNKRGIAGDAEALVLEHLANAETEEIYTAKPRIILVSEGFSPELTTCALWLNSTGLDITCIRMQPYRSGTELLVETSQIIPLPDTQDYLVKVRAREEEQAKGHQSGTGKFYPGGETFRDQIKLAQPENQAALEKLYNWAVGLKEEGLAALSTYKHFEKCNLRVGLPVSNNPCLIRVIMGQRAVRFSRRYFEQYAPGSIPSLETQTGQKISGLNRSFNFRLEDVDDNILGSLREAYREAAGRLDR